MPTEQEKKAVSEAINFISLFCGVHVTNDRDRKVLEERFETIRALLQPDTVTISRDVVEKVIDALKPFASSLDRASTVIREDADDDISHIVRATTFFLSYNNFLLAQSALSLLAQAEGKL
jgi:hypothetical protein